MALKTIQAAALAVSLTMNSAQFTAAMNKAVATGNSAKAGLIKAFNAIARGAKSMATSVGVSIKDGVIGALKMAPAAAMLAVAGITAYTGAVVANRLEAKRLADQYKVTWRQAQQLSYIAGATGGELEDYLDALKEVSIKAGDVIEGGGGVTNTMSAFFKRTGMTAAEWAGENDPIKKFDALYDSFQQLNDAEKVRVLDEMGDAGLKMGASFRMSREELEQLKKTGEATGSVMDITAIQEAQSKFSYMTRVGNDFLTGVVSKLAPVFTATMNSLIDKMTTSFEAKGGFKEGFQFYVDEWSNKIFTFLMNTISAVASFMDSLRAVSNSMLSGLNWVIDKSGGSRFKQYSQSDLSKEDQAKDQLYTDNLKLRVKAEQEAADATRELQEANAAASKWDLTSTERQTKALEKQRNANIALNESQKYQDQYNDWVKHNNDKSLAAVDTEANSKAADKINAELVKAKAKAAKALKDALTKEDNKPNKPGKSLVSDVADAADAAKAASSKQDKALSEYQKKLQDQYERIAEIKERYRKDDRSAWQKQTKAELDDVNEGFRAARTIIEDGYNRQLEDAKGNLKLQAELKAKMNKEIVENEKKTQEAIKWLQDQQHKRFMEQQDEVLKQLRRNHEAKMRDLGARGASSIKNGKAGLIMQNRQAELDMEQDYNDQLEQLEKDGYNKQSEAYKELQAQKLEALKAFHEQAAKEESAHGDGMFSSMMRMGKAATEGVDKAYGQRQSMIEGYTLDDVANARSRASEIEGTDAKSVEARLKEEQRAHDAQLAMTIDGADQITAEAGKKNKKMFELNKKIKIAEALMSTYKGASAALEWGMPLGPIFAGMTIGMGMANIAMIRQQQWTGQAHDGIDYVPNTGTWNLETGERVVDKRTNQDLKQALKSGSMNQRAGSTTTISAPFNIPPGTLIDEGGMQDLLSMHVKHITKIVDQQKSDRGY